MELRNIHVKKEDGHEEEQEGRRESQEAYQIKQLIQVHAHQTRRPRTCAGLRRVTCETANQEPITDE